MADVVTGGPGRFPTVKYAGIALSPRAWQSCWVKTHRARIDAVLRAGTRSGPLAWEIRDLFVRPEYQPDVWDVLEQIAVPAGRAGAHRVFLRLPEGSELFDQARRAGYTPVTTEIAYRAESAETAAEKLTDYASELPLRPRTQEDLHGLFRLYCSSTPVDYRARSGETLSEWADAIERPGRNTTEWVLDGEGGRIAAWLRTADTRAGLFFTVTCARDSSDLLPGLVAAGLARNGSNNATTLVPSHDQGLMGLLEDVGFEPVGAYEVTAKILAVRAAERIPAVAALG